MALLNGGNAEQSTAASTGNGALSSPSSQPQASSAATTYTPAPVSNSNTSSSAAAAVATSSSGPGSISIAALLAPLLPTKIDAAQQLISSSTSTNNNNNKLNIETVRRAFDAAAFAIIRGNQRNAVAAVCSSTSMTHARNVKELDTNSGNEVGAANGNLILVGAAAAASSSTNSAAAAASSSAYDPPLLVAKEAIRSARIGNLVEASSKSVPAFLKKNNTIPWFHIPIEKKIGVIGMIGATTTTNEGGGGGSSNKSSSDKGGSRSRSGAGGEGKIGGSSGKKGSSKSTGATTAGKVKKEGAASSSADKKRKKSSSTSGENATAGKDDLALSTKKAKVEKGSASAGAGASAGATSKTVKGSSAAATKKVEKNKDDNNKAIADTKKAKTTSSTTTAKKATTSSTPKKKSTTTTILNPSSGSPSKKIISPTSGTSKPKKTSGTPGRQSVSTAATEGGLTLSSNNSTVTRAIISAAATGVFQELNPDNDVVMGGTQEANNVAKSTTPTSSSSSSTNTKPKAEGTKNKYTYTTSKKKEEMVNMDQVVAQAKRLGNRVLDNSNGAARRGDQRREFRMDGALSRMKAGGDTRGSEDFVAPAHSLPLIIPNPFVTVNTGSAIDKIIGDSNNVLMNDQLLKRDEEMAATASLQQMKLKGDVEWSVSCLPRLLDVLKKGAGHAVIHDRKWADRSSRVANLLQNLAISPSSSNNSEGEPTLLNESTRGYPNYGPHLIVTSSGEEFDKFASVFGQMGHGLKSSVFRKGAKAGGSDTFSKVDVADVMLRVLPYKGTKRQRSNLRKHFGSIAPSPESHFSFLAGLPESPFHVILTTYSVLFEDYAHFCQIPFQAVVFDDGMSWLGCAHLDANGKVGKFWSSGLWNNFDHGTGKAGVVDSGDKSSKAWDFSKDVDGFDVASSEKNTVRGGNIQLGLTARHRILLASNMHAKYRGQLYKAPVMGLLAFLAPQFADAIKDDWERSRVFSCKQSMAYIRTMIARLIVVYSGDSLVRSPSALVMLSSRALDGDLPMLPFSNHTSTQEDEGLEKLIKSQKIVHSRKFAVSWFQPFSSIRKEIGVVMLDPILTAIKKGNSRGFVCEEIVTASSLSASGASGSVVGLSAYRAATRCGRVFSSEQGLKHHISSAHAPPGTWLCRNCGGDCGTSQARTHHERTCKVTKEITAKSPIGTAPQPAGQVIRRRGPKKKVVKVLEAKLEKASKEAAKDGDGSTRVSGYKGVWKQSSGKFFVKVEGKPLLDTKSEKESPLLFDKVEDAAKKFDEVISRKGEVKEGAMNFRSDGSRVVNKEDATPDVVTSKSASSSVFDPNIITPDLSIIDIKKLPPHVKPLLRDPNFTSRTGGNSKRYVYAYRGVCRQQRKGHDRWQSQISFNGQNHYLGTFDSEWDAAAVYSWAHLLLYGEEATKKAAQEGEEAAAAFAQQEKDIAEGKIPPPSSKPAKKKKRGAPRKNPPKDSTPKKATTGDKPKEVTAPKPSMESESSDVVPESASSIHGKKKRPISLKEWSKLKTECAMMLSSGTKGTSKATILGTRKDIADMNEKVLLNNISSYISGTLSSVSKSFLQPHHPSSASFVKPRSSAILIGLAASDFGWAADQFIGACHDITGSNVGALSLQLSNEFGPGGANRSFRSFILSPTFSMGRASKGFLSSFSTSIDINSTIGIPVGDLDCNVGGPDRSCSELAVKIQFLPTMHSNFQITVNNNDDIVSLNGKRIIASNGAMPLRDRDICGVGARVFVFIEKMPF